MSSGPPPLDRPNKRSKGDGPMGGPPPDAYHGAYAPGRYQQPPYGPGPGGPSITARSGYIGWQHGQYGSPPPHTWSHATPPPPGAMYPQQGGPMTPDRGYGSAYQRGPPPPMQGPPGARGRLTKPQGPPGPGPSRPPPKTPEGGLDGPPGSSYQGGGWGPGGQWSQSQWGNGQPGGPPPPMHHPPGYTGGAPRAMYGGSPPRQRPPRGSPDMMVSYPGGPPPSSIICQTVDNVDMEMFHSRGTGMDDESSSVAGGNSSSKDKGRGSYKCGRCGVPKKGHVCPYQPKLTRRPGEPLPEMRSAAIQVEMDEFMTLRRLNLRIQGFPESYASEPYLNEDMVVGEPRTPHLAPSDPQMMTTDSPVVSGPPPESVAMMGSSMRNSPLSEQDPITGAA